MLWFSSLCLDIYLRKIEVMMNEKWLTEEGESMFYFILLLLFIDFFHFLRIVEGGGWMIKFEILSNVHG